MTLEPDQVNELRVLLMLATKRDTTIVMSMLSRSNITVEACANATVLTHEISLGTGAVVVAEEWLDDPDFERVLLSLRSQPPWSDLPVIVAGRSGLDAQGPHESIEQLGNVTILERPMRIASLVSSVQTALGARRRQYQLRATLNGLREADERKNEFLATLAHELRNPLAPLRTALNILLLQNPDPEKMHTLHAMMDRQVTHMVRLIDDLMEVSRMTRGKITLRPSVISLNEVVRDAVEVNKPMTAAAKQHVVIELPPQPLHVQGDDVRLTQVVSNLLNNASKFTPAQGRIHVSVDAVGGMVRVQVTDSGIGIPEAMLDSIFGLFVQINGTKRAAQAGLGIGLTLVRSLVELHGGRVYASSSGTGKGTTITVELPLVTAPLTKSDVPRGSEQWIAASRNRVLVVDDNHDAADMLAQMLEEMGANAAVAHSGEEALQMMAASPPSIAFLDIGMPIMSGYQLAAEIRANDTLAGITLIALTGWGQTSDRERILTAGFDHHLIKPADISQLTHLLNMIDSAVLGTH